MNEKLFLSLGLCQDMESWSKDNFYKPSSWLFRIQKFWLLASKQLFQSAFLGRGKNLKIVQHPKDIIHKDTVLDPQKEEVTSTLNALGNLSQAWQLAG